MQQAVSTGSLVAEGARVVGGNFPSSGRVLVFVLWAFAAVAMIFEPLVLFGCLSGGGISVVADWRISNCPDGVLSELWRTYANWDPLFIRVPPFLRIMCAIEVFLFGPSYAVCALALSRNPVPRWFPAFALFFSGALAYSTVVFFAYECLFAPEDFVNFPMVCLVHGPWSVLPVVLSSKAAGAIREMSHFGPSSSRGIIGCFNSDKWS